MIGCSACILTYNSAKTLKYCLESVRNFSDIVILDGGSNDRTLDIARKYSARIYPQQEDGSSKKISDFTAMREKLYALAFENWVLCIDSDEYLSAEAVEKIREITENGEKNKNNLYTILRKAIINDKIMDYAFFYPEPGRRLWNRNSSVRLKAGKKVHENMTGGEEIKIKNLDVVMYHFWLESYKELVKKDEHYLKIAMEGKSFGPIDKRLKKALINILKAGNIFLKSLHIYTRYGFKKTLPMRHSWRFVRYHLIFAKKIIFS